jgi:hypothetical protein
VQNYTPGTDFNNDEFLDFIYTSNFYPPASPFEITRDHLQTFDGSIGSTTGPYTVSIFSDGRDFFLSSQGPSGIGEGANPWCLGGGCAADMGPTHTWSLGQAVPTPEPATASILIDGLAALGLVRRRDRARS